ncbi:MAG: histidine phosphatase family protein [Bdellovibrionaceae bacterium]|nr:histidine phosphatase family protein [Bdellovibrio sp.]
MKFVLVRHAQKGITPFEDPELNPEGFHQARVLNALVKQNELPAPTHAWASPKIRTTQTLKSMCEEQKVEVQINELLDLRLNNESVGDFHHRIQKFLDAFEKQSAKTINQTHYICTHYDWIEEAMSLIKCDKDLKSFEFSHWSPAQFVIFEILDGTWTLIRKGSPTMTKGMKL